MKLNISMAIVFGTEPKSQLTRRDVDKEPESSRLLSGSGAPANRGIHARIVKSRIVIGSAGPTIENQVISPELARTLNRRESSSEGPKPVSSPIRRQWRIFESRQS
jgi:hypothetical protein